MGHWLAPPGSAKTLGDGEAVRRALLDRRFPAADDGERGDDRAGRAPGRGGLLPGRRSGRADLGGGGPVGPSAARATRRRGISGAAGSRFRWRSGGVKPLDAVHGPTLTIEGRDADGAARSWFVRLWNYAEGDARGCRDRRSISARWRAAGRRTIRSGRAMSTGCSCRWSRRAMTAADAPLAGAGGRLGGAERDRLRRLGIGAGDRRRAWCPSTAADRDRL